LVEFAQAVVGHFTSGLAMVAVVACMFFAAVSGNLVGMIGSSNNPVSHFPLAECPIG
jgi:TRAP-type C4-dicarboxylate transport system permease large subunit